MFFFEGFVVLQGFSLLRNSMTVKLCIQTSKAIIWGTSCINDVVAFLLQEERGGSAIRTTSPHAPRQRVLAAAELAAEPIAFGGSLAQTIMGGLFRGLSSCGTSCHRDAPRTSTTTFEYQLCERHEKSNP